MTALSDLAALVFVAAVMVALLYVDRGLTTPVRVVEAPAPKFVVVDPPTKHEPRLVTKGTR